MAKFKEGEIVQLKSGGPKITVKEITRDGKYICIWFSGSKLELGIFTEAALIVPSNGDKGKK